MPSPVAGFSKSVLIPTLLGAALGGCATSADVSYSEYRFGPGFETERIYENRLYGDTTRGLGSESCQVVARRQFNADGEVSTREETVCDEF